MLKEDPLTPRLIGAALHVHTVLGPGLLESAYERCLQRKLELEGFTVECQRPVSIDFEGLLILCAYKIDLMVNSTHLIEIKSVEKLHPTHISQVVTYLKLSKLKYGLLLNFNCSRLSDGIKRILNES